VWQDDFEGYGRRDLIHSPLNALASTANYLKKRWLQQISFFS
jgi:membrane-bound lytic murein transglycosylase B